MGTERTLEERGNRYGKFSENAKDSAAVRETILPGVADPVIYEGVDYIIKKLVRIKGDPYYIDTYRDIAGYAELLIDYLQNECEQARDAKVQLIEKGVDGQFSTVSGR